MRNVMLFGEFCTSVNNLFGEFKDLLNCQFYEIIVKHVVIIKLRLLTLMSDRLNKLTNFSHLTCAEMPQYHNSDTHHHNVDDTYLDLLYAAAGAVDQ